MSSNQKYGVWDSFNDRALALSPSLESSEVCRVQGCNGLVDSQSWAQGYRMCGHCMIKLNSDGKATERSEQTACQHTPSTNTTAADAQSKVSQEEQANEQAFRVALEREAVEQRLDEIWKAVPAHWKIDSLY